MTLRIVEPHEDDFQKLMRVGSPPDDTSARRERRFKIFFWGGSLIAILGTGLFLGLAIANSAYHPIFFP